MSKQRVFVVTSMDCEPARIDVSDHGWRMSGSGPADYQESARSIRGYAAIAGEVGFPLSLFVHPQVAAGHPELLLELESTGACLGLHLHPYKFTSVPYQHDLGYYSATDQRRMIDDAANAWRASLGRRPRYFRGGVFSANDCTFGVLEDLGFKGGSVSIPGRVLPGAYAVWAGAEPYPHRAHRNFRQVRGDSDFIEVPIAVATSRPTVKGDRGEQGFEWPYVPSKQYDHPAVIRSILARFRADGNPYPTIVLNTHNDMPYGDPEWYATKNLRTILNNIVSTCEDLGQEPVGATIEAVCEAVACRDR